MQSGNIKKLLTTYEELIDRLDGVAQDQRTPPGILEKLSALRESQVTASVMLNPHTPTRILEKELKLRSGVGGTDEEARIHISYNPALRIMVLKKLIKSDPSPAVRAAGRRALAMRKKNEMAQ
jgi:hypothetical protein